MSRQYDLNCEFDIEQHKIHYVNYLEVIITENGVIKYAVPSHQEKLVSELCHKYNCTRAETLLRCPRDMYFDFMRWLTDETGCIAVWNEFYYGKANELQKRTLLKLKQEGLYSGPIIFEKSEKW